jgi:hypothetical protein
MPQDEYPDKTVYVNEGIFQVAAFGMSKSPGGGTDIMTWLAEGTDAIACAGILMIAAAEIVPTHMRVKLLAMMAEITEILKAQEEKPPGW